MHRNILKLTPCNPDSPDSHAYRITLTRQRRNNFGIWVEEYKKSITFPSYTEAQAACMALTWGWHEDA